MENLETVYKVLIFSGVAFVTIFIFSKLMGKKQIAQLDFVDYVIGISIGSIAADMAFDVDKPIWSFILAMAIFFALDIFVSFIGRKGSFLKRVFKGKPKVLIYEGKLNYENLKKSKLDINDLLAMSREKNYFDLSEIYYAIFETNGTLSIIPVDSKRPIVANDLNITTKTPTLPNYLVVDGAISFSGLNEISKTVEWLYNQMGINDKKDLKEVLLAQYDDKNDKVIVQYKKP